MLEDAMVPQPRIRCFVQVFYAKMQIASFQAKGYQHLRLGSCLWIGRMSSYHHSSINVDLATDFGLVVVRECIASCGLTICGWMSQASKNILRDH